MKGQSLGNKNKINMETRPMGQHMEPSEAMKIHDFSEDENPAIRHEQNSRLERGINVGKIVRDQNKAEQEGH
jgi:hypothetical protein